jgi:hypothetical protein
MPDLHDSFPAAFVSLMEQINGILRWQKTRGDLLYGGRKAPTVVQLFK